MWTHVSCLLHNPLAPVPPLALLQGTVVAQGCMEGKAWCNVVPYCLMQCHLAQLQNPGMVDIAFLDFVGLVLKCCGGEEANWGVVCFFLVRYFQLFSIKIFLCYKCFFKNTSSIKSLTNNILSYSQMKPISSMGINLIFSLQVAMFQCVCMSECSPPLHFFPSSYILVWG